MEKAIKAAIEGGYSHSGIIKNFTAKNKEMTERSLYIDKNRLLLNPLFWKALGISLGWNRDQSGLTQIRKEDWLPYQHKFVDHLAEGKDINGFFEELLK